MLVPVWELQALIRYSKRNNLTRKTKYHPYSKKHQGGDVIATCPVCKKDVIRREGFVVRETWFPEITKELIHHSPTKNCFEILCKQEKADEESKRKKKLGLPDNPLDDLLDNL